MALGAGSLFYTPPPGAAALARSGAAVPLWIAAPDDFVLMPETQHGWADEMADRHGLARPWRGESIDACVPWGWSTATVNQLLAAGVPRDVLPSAEDVENVKMLSHRRLTVKAHRALETGLEPAECGTPDECEEAFQRWGKVVGKYPWSSTGRGLFSGEKGYELSFLRRCRGAINHQGSVMIERAFDVAVDFAMLFSSDGHGEVPFRGYSLFTTHNRAYVGNCLASQEEIESILTQTVGSEPLHRAMEKLKVFLAEECGRIYEGPIGVDMMVYRAADGSLQLNPCVEINMRFTMGVAAGIIYRRHLPDGFRGLLQVTPAAKNSASTEAFLSLTPPGLPFSFQIVRSEKQAGLTFSGIIP